MMTLKDRKKIDTIDQYIEIAKGDITVHIIMTIIIFLLLLYIGYRVDWYYIVILDIFMVLFTIERVDAYVNLKKIKKYLTNNRLISKIGKIDFWNEKDYFLTDNYMIIIRIKDVYVIKYKEIKEIYVENNIELGKNSKWEEFLRIITKKGEFRVLVWTNLLVGEEFYNLKKYLLEKNPKIKVSDSVKKKITPYYH